MSEIAPWLANSRWATVPIRYLAKLGTGHTPSRQNSEYWENCSIPWVTLADVWQFRDGTVSFVQDTKEKISALGLANSAAVKHPAGTVILSRTASVGFSAIMGKDMATSQDFAAWSCGRQLDPRFLLYVLRAMAPDLRRVAAGSTHKTIYMPDIEQLRTPLPPLDEQRRIADFLDAEKRSIGLLKSSRTKQLDLLVERRSAVLSDCVSGETLGLADEMPHPVLGPVPHDAKVLSLKRVVPQITVGVVVNPSTYFCDSGVHFVHGYNVRDGWLDITDVKWISREDSARLWKSQLRAGDVLVVRAGAPGRAAVVPNELDGANCASVLILKRGMHVLPEFLAAFFNAPQGRGQVSASQYGAAQDVISVAQVREYLIALPSLDVQQRLVLSLKTGLSQVDRLVSAIIAQLERTDERWRSLVTAAVTGQVDASTAGGVAA